MSFQAPRANYSRGSDSAQLGHPGQPAALVGGHWPAPGVRRGGPCGAGASAEGRGLLDAGGRVRSGSCQHRWGRDVVSAVETRRPLRTRQVPAGPDRTPGLAGCAGAGDVLRAAGQAASAIRNGGNSSGKPAQVLQSVCDIEQGGRTENLRSKRRRRPNAAPGRSGVRRGGDDSRNSYHRRGPQAPAVPSGGERR